MVMKREGAGGGNKLKAFVFTPLLILSVVSITFIAKQQGIANVVSSQQWYWRDEDSAAATPRIRLGHDPINATRSISATVPPPPAPRPEDCRISQLKAIQRDLPAEDCIANRNKPWLQNCSFTRETKCPETTWIESYYTRKLLARAAPTARITNSFLGIYVGCNKGFDAIDAMRMGTADPTFDKKAWKTAIFGDEEFHLGVCNQEHTPQFNISSYSSSFVAATPTATNSTFSSELHCIEPLPKNAMALSFASKKLGLDQRGFVVSHAALARENGYTFFPGLKHNDLKTGVENKGIESCQKIMNNNNAVNDPSYCEEVPMYNLDTYAEKFISGFGKKNDNGNEMRQVIARRINILSIDVEGYDFDVLLGGQNTTLSHVEYLEFEYNWMGSWRQQNLFDAIRMLDEMFYFSCYWPGTHDNKLWRITGCYLDHYNAKHWSNVACVSRILVPVLAREMEEMFLRTIDETAGAAAEKKNSFVRE